MLAVVFGLVAQRMLELRLAAPLEAVGVYLVAIALLLWSYMRQELAIVPIPEPRARAAGGLRVSKQALLVGLALAYGTFVTCRGGSFTALNVTLWLAATTVVLYALWRRDGEAARPAVRDFLAGVRSRLARRHFPFAVTPWLLCLAAVVLVSAFFRLYRIGSVPAEMISDHAEKLLDIRDVLDGKTPIYFARNAGREPMQFYLTAAIARFFGFGPSFLSLKLLMALVGIGGLTFMYLLGKDFGGRWVGLLTMLLCGFAYWPNVLGRIGLRLILAPCFAAATLFFALRGVRTGDHRKFLFAGLALGLGLYGYTAIWVVPLLVGLAAILMVLHSAGSDDRRRVIQGLAGLVLVAVVVAMPLAAYAADHPAQFFFRTLTRVTSLEHPLPGPVPSILLGNLGNALAMLCWGDGNIWSICIPKRPALDVVTAAMFVFGSVLLTLRYAHERRWPDLFLLGAVPVSLLPSVLSVAFPGENPSLSRAGCAIVPVFIVAAFGLEWILVSLATSAGRLRSSVTLFAGLVLLGTAAAHNYDLVFRQYDRQYRSAAWNASEIGRVARGFADSIGTSETVFVVGYPYWVDTRLVSFEAGFRDHDIGISAGQIAGTAPEKRAKLFVLHPADNGSLMTLRRLYPRGLLSRGKSATPGKDFLLYFVAADPGFDAPVPGGAGR